jgi:hypothetical protein
MTVSTLADLVYSTIDFADVLASAEIVPDDDCRSVFEDQDTYNHTLERADDASREAFDVFHHNRELSRVCLNLPDYGWYTWARSAGCSRQVAREFEAKQARQCIEQIIQIYNGDFRTYCAQCDVEGFSDSLGGIDGFDDASHWEYLETCRVDVADQVAEQLTRHRYTVTNRPDRRAGYNTNRISHFRRCLSQFDQ